MADKVIFLTTTGLNTWTVPSDWTNSNTVECIGGGGAGGCINYVGSPGATGGGGGGYSKKANITTLTANATVYVNIGTGGNAHVITGSGFANSNSGSLTQFSDVVSTNITSAYVGTSSNQNNYTIVSRQYAIPNGATVTKLGLGSTGAGTVSMKIVQRTSATHYTPKVIQSYAHGGTGWEDCTLSTPYVVPSTGEFYVAVYAAAGVNSGWAGTAATGSRAFVQSDLSVIGNDYILTEDSSYPCATRFVGYLAICSAQGGSVGDVTTSANKTGGAGGSSSLGIGDTKYSGGRGGNYTHNAYSNPTATGGGGAAGWHGAGANGSDATAAGAPTASNGGQGDVTYGGAGSSGSTSGNASNASDGEQYTSNPGGITAGPGGGGGAVAKATAQMAGNGGNYGGGGGAAACTAADGTLTSGAGKQGIIIVTYTPLGGQPFNPGTGNFRIRFSIANPDAAESGDTLFQLYVSKNGGEYSAITTSSTGGVKSVNAGSDADNTIIRIPRLTAGA